MTIAIEKIFLPSIGVDVVFNMNSMAPYSRSSIIYDVDFPNEVITIAQPKMAFSKNTSFKELHLTTIIQEKNRKTRLGVQCNSFNIINRYLLANKTYVQAVLLKYELPVEETNIRSAFRLPLSSKYTIKCKILIGNMEYTSQKDFSIRDISLNGIGIVIPKTNIKNPTPLSEIIINKEIGLEIILSDTDDEDSEEKISICARITRINPRYSETYILIGLKIINLSNQNELILSKFIHDVQVKQLKRLKQ